MVTRWWRDAAILTLAAINKRPLDESKKARSVGHRDGLQIDFMPADTLYSIVGPEPQPLAQKFQKDP
jgi:hypothetical protein